MKGNKITPLEKPVREKRYMIDYIHPPEEKLQYLTRGEKTLIVIVTLLLFICITQIIKFS